ncbi:MAG: hypothetical protein AAGD43_11090 [Pseudomonadota bacterium]
MQALIGLVGFALLIWLMFGGLQRVIGWLNHGDKKSTHGLHGRGNENARTDGD